MTKFAILCYLLSHGPSSPLDISQGYSKQATKIYQNLLQMELDGLIVFQHLAGKYELRFGTDRIALHEECRK